MSVPEEQMQFFRKNGYLILRNVLSEEETKDLQRWAQEVHDWPTDANSPWMPYEEINAQGQTVLCRTENYANSHAGLNGLLRGQKLLNLLKQLSGEDMLLFKEKINYKLAGSGGFAPHVDSTAYTHIKNIKHLAILLAVDPSDMSNGGLEVVEGSHEMNVPIGEDNCIEPDWVKQQKWTPVELKAGQVLVFGSYLAHRSGANHSNQDRKALYATYNCAREGDLHDEYYAHRKVVWPPAQLRKKGEEYKVGALVYGFGSPMLSVDAGKQLEFDEEEWKSKPRAAKAASRIIDILNQYGNSDYIGEPISQIEHSLQCAYLAAQNMADPQTVAAALLHDIGQIIPERDAEHILGGAQVRSMRQNSGIGADSRSSDSVGRVSHETLGAQYLLALGFPAKVAELVEAHVPAKRYLCATEKGYYSTLSDASKESLRFQGGPMSPDEVRLWQEGSWADEKANLRRWDDGAKVVGLTVPGLETYRPVLEQVLSS
ncbi:uncharacterized protein Z520_09369 [Fonsecaea multimorphosa CBS 102226]|uniref:HD domain-containing protein n=1 Tax=Fonsecaea multimorphosa CBS 102226 TaxID=1442371 RepID=A0A0D2JX20_9EURO|nr:uncharacterized protein Z520_09369 [Fonsecaea multimorphosa CBS 102226]KIX95059.1 hypothetical protein Z520_09369 [Fonsecaea multimorphosa CBS 102226]OAL20703.1 hypothetical protein AYO22_08712 [Fonsecaea multimorphosa]